MTGPAKAVLVTRPRKQATQLLRLLTEAGFLPLWASPIEIEADAVALQALPQQLAAADVVFFVSPSAVDAVAAAVDLTAYRPQWVAVGQATASALRGLGLTSVWAPEEGHDSEAVLALPLWAALGQRQPSARILIVRGDGGRPWLANALTASGHVVTFAEVYRRQPQVIDWSALMVQQGEAELVAVCVTSSEIGRGLWAQIPDSLQQRFKNLLYLTPHERISQTLQTLGADRVVTCALGDDNMVSAIQVHERA
ncbi:MAG: uroporphyrinogen-III synthase [Neisseriaceae bacterium]